MSDEYFDKLLFESDPVLLRQVCDALIGLLPQRVDAVAGLELACPAGHRVSQRSGLPTRFVRKKAKDYATCRGSPEAAKWQIAAWLSSKTASAPAAN